VIDSTRVEEATQELIRRCRFVISIIFVSGIIAPILMFSMPSDSHIGPLGCLFLILINLVLFIVLGLKYFVGRKVQHILIDTYCVETYAVDVLGYLACIMLEMTIINPLTLSFRVTQSMIYRMIILVLVVGVILFIAIIHYISIPIRKIEEEEIIPSLKNKDLGKFVFDFMDFASTAVFYREISRKLVLKHIRRITEFSEQILLGNKRMLEPLKKIKRIAQEIITKKAEIQDTIPWKSLQDIIGGTILIVEILFDIMEDFLSAPVCIGGNIRKDLENIRKALKKHS